MKKFAVLLLAVGLSFGLTNQSEAYSELIDSDRSGQWYAEKELKEAKQERLRNYLKEKLVDTPAYKNMINQSLRHTYSRRMSNTDEVSTFMNRSGELNTVQDYKYRRANSGANYQAPNNSKRNFRTRAIDYYLNGGEAGSDVLSTDVVYGSTHQVQVYSAADDLSNNDAYDVSSVRNLLKANLSDLSDQAPTGHQTKITMRKGAFTNKNYLSPYMSRYYLDRLSEELDQ